MNQKQLNYIDLFSGAGGFAKGFLQAGYTFKNHFYSEIDKYAISLYRKQFPEAKHIGSVVSPGSISLKKGDIDLLTFGSPCQDLSMAGNREGLKKGDKSSLFFNAIKIIKKYEPKTIVFENVKGLFSTQNGKDFATVLREIANCGDYQLEWQLVNSKWVLPQNRERVFIVGHLRGSTTRKVFPIQETSFEDNYKVTAKNNITYWKNSRTKWAIENRKNIPALKTQTDLTRSTLVDANSIKIISGLKSGYETATDGDFVQMAAPNSGKRGRVQKNNTNTLTTANSEAIVMSAKNQKLRRLTMIERERLQGFTDNWTSQGVDENGQLVKISDTQRINLTGNAVTVDMVQLIASRLAGVEFKRVPKNWMKNTKKSALNGLKKQNNMIGYNQVIKGYNDLQGKKLSRYEVGVFIDSAKKNDVYPVISKLTGLLKKYPTQMGFEFLKVAPIELQEDYEALGIPYLSNQLKNELGDCEVEGLGKRVSSNAIYDMITNNVIHTIEKTGRLPWYNGRNDTDKNDDFIFMASPINYNSKKHYRGINAFILSHLVGDTIEKEIDGVIVKVKQLIPIVDEKLTWLTFKQIKQAKGKLKQGAKSNQAMFFNWIHKHNGKNVTAAQFDKLQFNAKAGDELDKFPTLRYYNVFNERDIEGIDFVSFREKLNKKSEAIRKIIEDKKILSAELVLKNMPNPPKLVQQFIGKGQSPHYTDRGDRVVMPLMSQYDDVSVWYGTAFHEFTHSTGSEKRLDRKTLHTYHDDVSNRAQEELVAEIGSMFLNAESGIYLSTLKKNEAYINGWAKSIKKTLMENNKAIFFAVGQAQKASDYILDLDKNGEPKYWSELREIVKKTPTETRYNSKADLLNAYFKGDLKVKELIEIAEKQFKTAVATTTELNSFLNNKSTQKIMAETYGISANILVKKTKKLLKLFTKTIPKKDVDPLWDAYTNLINATIEEVADVEKDYNDPDYVLGDMYKSNFDYYGMLDFILGVDIADDKKIFEKLHDSLEDVNYHDLAKLVWKIIGLKTTPPTPPKKKAKEPVKPKLEPKKKRGKNEVKTSNSKKPSNTKALSKKVATKKTKVETKNGQLALFGLKGINKDFAPTWKKTFNSSKEAIEYLKQKKRGQIKKALYHPKIGDIDLVWGENDKKNKGYGLKHILEKHGKEIENLGFEIEDYLPFVLGLEDLEVNKTGNRIVLKNKKHLVVILEKWDNEDKTFLLTAYDLRPEKEKTPDSIKTSNADTFTKKTLLSSTDVDHKNTKNIDPDKTGLNNLVEATPRQKIDRVAVDIIHQKYGNTKNYIHKSIRGIYTSKKALKIKEIYHNLAKTTPVAPSKQVVEKMEVATEPIKNIAPVKNNLVNNINHVAESKGNFIIGGDIGKFLGPIEIKPVGSVACTIDAPQGAGKTRFFFQVMNELAKNYKVLFISLEEHPQSSLFKDKVKQYIEPQNLKNIDTVGELEKGKEKQILESLVPNYDVILVDSWNKIFEASKLDFDTDLRKAYNGKLIFAIFQRTVTGSMRGGAKAQFDGDIIMKVDKGDDFKTNIVYHDKNRYHDADLTQLHYNIYDQKLVAQNSPQNTKETPVIEQPEPTDKKPLVTWDDATVFINY